MKTQQLTFTLALLLGTSFFTASYADTYQLNKEQRYEQRDQEYQSKHKKKPQNKYQQQQNNFRKNNNEQNTGQRRQDRNDYQKQNNREDRRYSTRRSESDQNIKYERYPKRADTAREIRKEKHEDSRYHYRDGRRDNRHYELKRGNRLLLLTPRHRTFRHVRITRPFGHSYFGYGHYLNDYNAWKWLTFTAISLKLLDMVDEQAQREHEAAQIAATTANIGERIYWDTDDASGYVATTREGKSSRGLPCREYQQSITVGGKTEKAYGTACLQADGAWEIVD